MKHAVEVPHEVLSMVPHSVTHFGMEVCACASLSVKIQALKYDSP